MGKANCKKNQELSGLIAGLKKQLSEAQEELKSPATRENPEAEMILRDAELRCQQAIPALEREKHLHEQHCPKCQKGG